MGHLVYTGIVLLSLLIFSSPIWQLAHLSLHNELYSHFMLIPMVSLFFVWVDRKALFDKPGASPVKGLVIMALGIAAYLGAMQGQDVLNRNDYLALCLLGTVSWIHGGFIGVYGAEPYRRALFPLFFLVLCIPIPTFMLDPVVLFLQIGSAHAVHLAFEMIGIPYLRDGMTFQLPGIAIEVAKECSGIRSSLILFITSLMAGHMFLKTTWLKVILVLVIIPLTIFKNAVRITTLSLLAVYVDKSWLTDSWLHKGGGIVFFVLALLFSAGIMGSSPFGKRWPLSKMVQLLAHQVQPRLKQLVVNISFLDYIESYCDNKPLLFGHVCNYFLTHSRNAVDSELIFIDIVPSVI